MEQLTSLFAYVERIGEQFHHGYTQGASIRGIARKRRIVCAGMGGSILGAECFQTLALSERIPVHVTIWQTYGLPHEVLALRPLVCCISYSGNTEETLSAFDTARNHSLPLMAFSTDGVLLRKAKNAHVIHPVIPDAIVPRFSVAYMFGFLTGMYDKQSVNPVKLPSALFNGVNPNHIFLAQKQIRKKAREIARVINSTRCLVYTIPALTSLGHVWEINLNETAKTLAFADDIPDIDHHALAALAWQKSVKDFTALVIRGFEESPAMRKRLKLSEQTLRSIGLKTISIQLEGKTIREKILFGLALAQMTGLELAKIKRVNPLETKIQERFKKQLRKP